MPSSPSLTSARIFPFYFRSIRFFPLSRIEFYVQSLFACVCVDAWHDVDCVNLCCAVASQSLCYNVFNATGKRHLPLCCDNVIQMFRFCFRHHENATKMASNEITAENIFALLLIWLFFFSRFYCATSVADDTDNGWKWAIHFVCERWNRNLTRDEKCENFYRRWRHLCVSVSASIERNLLNTLMRRPNYFIVKICPRRFRHDVKCGKLTFQLKCQKSTKNNVEVENTFFFDGRWWNWQH